MLSFVVLAVFVASVESKTCDTAQVLRAGKCVSCGTGQVGNTERTQCVACGGSPCTVRQPDDNFTASANCVLASSVCGSSSISRGGSCTPCSYGMVADSTRCKCLVCGQNDDRSINPALTVKAPNTLFSLDARCVAASDDKGCGTSEMANNAGQCDPCPMGQVANSLRSKCVVCGQGKPGSLNPPLTVKYPNNAVTAKARCVRSDAPLEGCGASEVANSSTGQCAPCSYGQVADVTRSRCVVCGQGSTGSVNPPGSVKYPNTNFDTGALCVRPTAFGGCGTNQIADRKTGQCVPCARGTVADAARLSCISCGSGPPSSLNPPSTVKSPDDGYSVNASCVSGALQGCGSNQVAQAGVCTACGYGKVADASHSSCVVCGQGVKSSVNPPASVKYPNDMVSVNASCVAARSENGCGTNEYANNATGLCSFCGDGQVANADRSGCEYCGAVPPLPRAKGAPKKKGRNAKGKNQKSGVCTIKNTIYYVKSAECIPASRGCGTNQVAVRGKCSSCPAGMIPDEGRCACVPCPACTVKVPNDGVALQASCVAAALVCGSSAVPGPLTQCVPCPVDQVADAGRCQCVACGANTDPKVNPTCSYKFPNDRLSVSAVCRAASSCGTSAISSHGKCEFCPYGQVASADGCRCIVCGTNTEPNLNPPLSVKIPNSNLVSTATCVSAAWGCGPSAIADGRGQCAPCPFGMVANEVHSACVVCGQGASTSRVNPPLSVKYPSNNHTANATCVSASGEHGCGTNQIVNSEGHCDPCSYGQVADSLRSQCITCGQGAPSSLSPPGTVKVPNHEFITSARCVLATEACGTGQYADRKTGQCAPCTFGMVADKERRTCIRCGRGAPGSLNSPGTVKYPNNGFAVDAICAPPLSACGSNQIADFSQGGCVPCFYGAVASADRLYCQDCAPLVKCLDDKESVNASCCYPVVDLPG